MTVHPNNPASNTKSQMNKVRTCCNIHSRRRGTWLPLGAVRPQSPLLDAVFERYENANKLGKDLENEYVSSTITGDYKCFLVCR